MTDLSALIAIILSSEHLLFIYFGVKIKKGKGKQMEPKKSKDVLFKHFFDKLKLFDEDMKADFTKLAHDVDKDKKEIFIMIINDIKKLVKSPQIIEFLNKLISEVGAK